MRCTKCGVDNVKNAQYCKNCGNNFNESLSKDSKKNRAPKHIKIIYWSGWLELF